MTYRALSERSNQYARWALAHGLVKGGVVGLLMTNRPEYFAIWLGITSVGGVVALLNTNLVGASLAHCIDTVSPRHLIVSEEYVDTTVEAMPDMAQVPAIWTHGVDHPWFRRIDFEIQGSFREALTPEERRPVSIADRALYIYTSGTTGLPKAAIVSHARVMQWSYWFAGMMGPQPDDRLYNCLPMYHSVGGVQVRVQPSSPAPRWSSARSSPPASFGTTSSIGTARCSSTSESCADTCSTILHL